MAGCASPSKSCNQQGRQITANWNTSNLTEQEFFSTKRQCDFQNKGPLSTQPVGADYFFAHNTHSQCALPSSKETASKKTAISNNHSQCIFGYIFHKKHTNSLISRQIILKHALKHTFTSLKNIQTALYNPIKYAVQHILQNTSQTNINKSISTN